MSQPLLFFAVSLSLSPSLFVPSLCHTADCVFVLVDMAKLLVLFDRSTP